MYTFGDACFAIPLKAPALRQWLQRGVVTLQNGYGSGAAGERTGNFTLDDIGVLTLTRELTEFGLSVGTSFRTASRVIERRWLVEDPPPVGQLRTPRPLMLLRRNEDGTLNMTFFENDDAVWYGKSFIVVDIAAVVTEGIRRANEHRQRRFAEKAA